MLIVDIGAHDGEDFSLPYAKNRGSLVYAIEPVPELAGQMQAHQLPNLQVSCLAIGGEEGTYNFLVSQDKSPYLFLRTDALETQLIDKDNLRTLEVSVMRLDTFMKVNYIAEIDLLRINDQSNSFQIIRSAGDSIHNIKKIKLKISSSPFQGDTTERKEITSCLEASGFRLTNQQSDVDNMEEDLTFVRVYRYAKSQRQSEIFEVNVPHIGLVETPKNDLVGRLLEQNLFEGPEQAFLWLYLQPGDIFFDCGAHAGIFSCIAAKKLQNEGQIFGFEPIKNNVDLYKSNLKRLGNKCFTVMQVGLSNQLGEAPLYLGKSGLSAYSTFVIGAQAHEQIGEQSIMVDQMTLDKVVEDFSIDSVALAKLDVEGWEIPVLMGAAESIKQSKLPLWMIEFTEENAVAAGSSTYELASVIEGFGYTLCRFDSNQFQLVPEVKRSRYDYENLFAAMDIHGINDRLKSASPSDQRIAKDIVNRWDLASRAEEARILLDTHQRLSKSFDVCEADRAARLEQINILTQRVQESEQGQTARLGPITQLTEWLAEARTDRAARLEQINMLTQRVQESEQDQAARLEQINQLTEWLEEARTDRAARLEQINMLMQQIQEIEQDRAARLEQINQLTEWLEEARRGMQ